MEKLTINNFLSIKNLEMNIKKFNVLIGSQGAGKSICVKLIYFCRQIISNQTAYSTIQYEGNKSIISFYLWYFESQFPRRAWKNKPFYIKYELEDTFFEFTFNGIDLVLNFSDNLYELFERVESIQPNNTSKSRKRKIKNKAIIEEFIIKSFPEAFHTPLTFVPATRSVISLITEEPFVFHKEKKILDANLKKFISNYQALKKLVDLTYRISGEPSNSFQKNFEEILGGKIRFGFEDDEQDKNKDIILHKDKRKVISEFASTGQQELLPLIHVLKMHLILSEKRPSSIIIEEPEAHLFPLSQKNVVNMLAEVVNRIKTGSIFITTHSPYILASINNLLKAGSIVKKIPEKSDEINKIVPHNIQLNSDDVEVYSIEKGKLISLIDKKSGLIKPNILDEIANQISSEFVKLLDLEYED